MWQKKFTDKKILRKIVRKIIAIKKLKKGDFVLKRMESPSL